MTDKQIIKDGVDVSGCEFCDYKSSNIPQCRIRLASFEPICEGYNCYYKQLKRKEQELNDYKKQFKADTKEMEDYQNKITRHLESIEYWQHQAELGVDTTNRLTKELEAKEQECERLNNELHKNFKEKNTLHFIIDRLLEASGYDTNTASAEDFEDVYEHMRYDKQQT